MALPHSGGLIGLLCAAAFLFMAVDPSTNPPRSPGHHKQYPALALKNWAKKMFLEQEILEIS